MSHPYLPFILTAAGAAVIVLWWENGSSSTFSWLEGAAIGGGVGFIAAALLV